MRLTRWILVILVCILTIVALRFSLVGTTIVIVNANNASNAKFVVESSIEQSSTTLALHSASGRFWMISRSKGEGGVQLLCQDGIEDISKSIAYLVGNMSYVFIADIEGCTLNNAEQFSF